MSVRLLSVRQTPASHLAAPSLLALMLLVMVLGIPDATRDVDAFRGYLAPEFKQAVLVAGGAAMVAVIAFVLVQVLMSTGVVGALYGRESRGSIRLETPWGRVGIRRHRLVVSDNQVKIRWETYIKPMGVYRRHGTDHLYVSSGRKVIHVATLGRFDPVDRESLAGWLRAHGLEVIVESWVHPH